MSFSASESASVVAAIVLNSALFVVVQWGLIRVVSPARLLLFSVGVFVGSAVLFLLLTYFMVGNHFSSVFSLLNFGVIVYAGSFGLCGLYTFLGPATADRSATAHLLMFLAENGGRLEIPAVIAGFDGRQFVQKRFAECERAGIIETDGRWVTLTPKGRRLSDIFAKMRAATKLESLPGYCASFCAKHPSIP